VVYLAKIEPDDSAIHLAPPTLRAAIERKTDNSVWCRASRVCERFPRPTREGNENSRNPFVAASPRDFRGLTVAAVWLFFGDHGLPTAFNRELVVVQRTRLSQSLPASGNRTSPPGRTTKICSVAPVSPGCESLRRPRTGFHENGFERSNFSYRNGLSRCGMQSWSPQRMFPYLRPRPRAISLP